MLIRPYKSILNCKHFKGIVQFVSALLFIVSLSEKGGLPLHYNTKEM